jgi:hypothetical protein
MCGLCHALGDGYGLPFRLLTGHEMILLNLLVTAQRKTDTEVVLRRCPLNPLRWVTTNKDVASDFAAATAVALAQVSLEDTVRDSAGKHLPARLGHRLLNRPYRMALATLERLGLATGTLTQLGPQQMVAEDDEAYDPAQPTAEAGAQLFARTAHLAGQAGNETALATIGACYGTYIYLMDAYRDFPEDMQQGHYNPLRRFCVQRENLFSLSHAGLRWLLERFKQLRAEIKAQLGQVQLHRHEALLADLLTGPLTHMIDDLAYQVLHQRDRAFRFWQIGDILKAAFFFLPPSLLFYNGDCDCGGGDSCGCDANPCACVDTSCIGNYSGDQCSCVDFSCIRTPCDPRNDLWNFACWDCSGDSSSRSDLCYACGYMDCGSHSADSSTPGARSPRKKKKADETPPDQPSAD